MEVIWTDAALVGLSRMPANKARALRSRILRVAAGDPLDKPLRGKLKGLSSVRLGDFRAILRKDRDRLVVTVVKVGPRKDVYA